MSEHNSSLEDFGSQRLTNDDFRRLLATPRSSFPQTPSSSSHLSERSSVFKEPKLEDGSTEVLDKAEQRKKRKSFYAKLKKQEDDKLAELAEKYRDRAKERRDGNQTELDPMTASSGYRAVAPDIKSTQDAAERRRQLIQESKFLGGDMEHTHLVKGLDYALLQKVRSEIQNKEIEQEEEMEKIVSKPKKGEKGEGGGREREKVVATVEEEDIQFKTRMGKSVYKIVLGNRQVERNPFFAPGRMAYVIDMQDEMIDTDIPTTLIRSLSDVKAVEDKPTLTTNDIVINKLAQILSYLRQGPKASKKHLRKNKLDRATMLDEPIYPDAGDYIPSVPSHKNSKQNQHQDDRKKIMSNLFNNNNNSTAKTPAGPAPATQNNESTATSQMPSSRAANLLSRLAVEPTGYAECYPGLDEMQDAIDDSDDEVDYTKMDLGNKKGPIGRWDFDTAEEYSTYMNNKEALPKAAFQYGVKMADGRRTRKFNKEKNERAELDREWNKIQNIISKRKPNEGGGGGGPAFKVPKY
uniref:Protein Red n=1 Tax=Cacopsylla melanoneura TaxID=428564 RepID=A0A8D8V705_9HEMI